MGTPLLVLSLAEITADAAEGERTLVATGVDHEGHEHVLTRHRLTAGEPPSWTGVLHHLIDRGFDARRGVLVVAGSGVSREAVERALGPGAAVQHCRRTFRERVLDQVDLSLHPVVKRWLDRAWAESHHEQAEAGLQALAWFLQDAHPAAAAEIRRRLEEVTTITRLGIPAPLSRTVGSLSPRAASDGRRRIAGFRQLPLLQVALEARLAPARTTEPAKLAEPARAPVPAWLAPAGATEPAKLAEPARPPVPAWVSPARALTAPVAAAPSRGRRWGERPVRVPPLVSALGMVALLTGLVAGLLMATVIDSMRSASATGWRATDEIQPPAERASRGDRATPRRRRNLIPVRLAIPSAGVRSRLVRLGLNPDGTLEVPSNFDLAGWYARGTPPGEPGPPAVMVGHVDSTSGPAVFYRLPSLTAGDAVLVRRANGTVAKFVVYRTAEYLKSAFPASRVYASTGRPEIRLITCSGEFDRSTGHYLSNHVVFARALPEVGRE